MKLRTQGFTYGTYAKQVWGSFLPSLLHLFFTRWQHQASSGSMGNKGEWNNFEGISQTELQKRNNKMWGSLALLWRQISSKAFTPSAINPPSHLPSALHLVHFCCHSDYFLVSLFLSILNASQLLCLLAPSFSQQLVPYFLTRLVLVVQPYNLVLPLIMPSFSNFLLPTFISTSPLPSIVPNFLFFPPPYYFSAVPSSGLFCSQEQAASPPTFPMPWKGQELGTLQHPEPSPALQQPGAPP